MACSCMRNDRSCNVLKSSCNLCFSRSLHSPKYYICKHVWNIMLQGSVATLLAEPCTCICVDCACVPHTAQLSVSSISEAWQGLSQTKCCRFITLVKENTNVEREATDSPPAGGPTGSVTECPDPARSSPSALLPLITRPGHSVAKR